VLFAPNGAKLLFTISPFPEASGFEDHSVLLVPPEAVMPHNSCCTCPKRILVLVSPATARIIIKKVFFVFIESWFSLHKVIENFHLTEMLIKAPFK